MDRPYADSQKHAGNRMHVESQKHVGNHTSVGCHRHANSQRSGMYTILRTTNRCVGKGLYGYKAPDADKVLCVDKSFGVHRQLYENRLSGVRRLINECSQLFALWY